MAHQPKHLARTLATVYALIALGLAYFAIYPAWDQGEPVLLGITLFWMLTLAAIMSVYGIAVVRFGGEDEYEEHAKA